MTETNVVELPQTPEVAEATPVTKSQAKRIAAQKANDPAKELREAKAIIKKQAEEIDTLQMQVDTLNTHVASALARLREANQNYENLRNEVNKKLTFVEQLADVSMQNIKNALRVR